LVKERIENTELIFVCMACGTKYKIKVKDYDERFKCKKCGGQYFGVAKSEKDLEDEKKLNITAELLRNYGKKFVFVYAGKGISYLSAKFLLKKEYKNEDELLMNIIEYEKRGMKFAKR
jgi:DNA-directed RNA polymerase subunit RPC12/RpoP